MARGKKKSARRAAEAVKQDFAIRELRRIATMCPTGIAHQILVNVRREHREGTQDERTLVKDVRDRGGVCFPGGMTKEEWANRLPRPLHGRASRCVPADELAQELFDRGQLGDPSSDAILDVLGEAYVRARSRAPLPDDKTLIKEAKRILADQIKRAAKELVATARRQGLASCPRIPKAPAPAMSGLWLGGG